MGYEIGCVGGEVDEEFLCAICALILEDPIELPCQHLYCTKCIKGWLAVKQICPIDRSPLALKDLKPTPQYFRDMLGRVEVKCKFEPNGCQTIVKLSQLPHHLTECAMRRDDEVIDERHIFQRFMSIPINQARILEYGGGGTREFTKSTLPMKPGNAVFTVKVLQIHPANVIAIGLTPTNHPINIVPGCNGTIGYWCKGHLFNNGRRQRFGPQWQVGDVVACVIRFPPQFTNDGNNEVEVQFSVNGQLIVKREIVFPLVGLSPTVYMCNHRHAYRHPKIEFLF